MSLDFRWTAAKYPPFGKCVYCGATDELSDEHIIPFALLPKGGDWYLPKASCPKCADITKRFEQIALRGMFSPLREKMGLKSRSKKTRVMKVRYYYPDGSLRDKDVPITEFPTIVCGFKWPVPGILVDAIPKENFAGEFVAKHSDDWRKHAIEDTQSFRIARVATTQFAQMLAKIAHVYAIAEYGEDSFDPLLPDLILGNNRMAPYLVGGDPRPLPDENQLHHVHRNDARTDTSPHYFGVSIRLFVCFGMPRYLVIVGRRLKEGPPSRKDGDTVAVHLPRTVR